jgi:hypothetical protein
VWVDMSLVEGQVTGKLRGQPEGGGVALH